ncbi:hypothetical protein JW992_11155, partial [candidate division KSB1 bacterium]|nr:hypothetical protein [candidate division KSB1 bacterium]
MVEKFCTLIFIMILTLCSMGSSQSCAESDSTVIHRSAQTAYLFLRGVEQEGDSGFRPGYSFFSVFTFVPKRLMRFAQKSADYGMALLTDSESVRKVESLFRPRDGALTWYPMFDLVSPWRPRVGLDLEYRRDVTGLFSARYAGREKYRFHGALIKAFPLGPTSAQMMLSVLSETDDDRQYYGLGSDPLTDSRNRFLTSAESDHGIYRHRRRFLAWAASLRLSQHAEVMVLQQVQVRESTDPGEGELRIGRVFDLETIPGFQPTLRRHYSELALRLDDRPIETFPALGRRMELYVGVSRSLDSNGGRFLRSGFHLSSDFVILCPSRILTPRLIGDTTLNLDRSVPIPFAEFPRQPDFRGVSGRKLLRSDC